MFRPLACGIHSHTDSSLDGASTPSQKIIRASELGRIADCVTDHGVMGALADHWFAAQKLYKEKKINKVQSIHGIEAYVIDDVKGPKVTTTKKGVTKSEHRYLHLTIHFKTAEAYLYFCRLTPLMEDRAIIKVGEPKPLIHFSELEPIAGQITLGSGCLVGMVQKWLLDKDLTEAQKGEAAEASYVRLRNLAGPGNFFVEIFPHKVEEDWVRPVYSKKEKGLLIKPGKFVPILEKMHVCGPHCATQEHFEDECGHKTVQVDLQQKANKFLIALAKKYGDPCVISEDSHFASPEDYIVQEARLGNGQDQWKFKTSYHMADSNDWAANLKANLGVSDRDIEEWIDNSYKFVELFKDYKLPTANDQMLLPNTDMIYEGYTGTTKDKFWELAKKHDKLPKPDHPQYQVYMDRIEYELSVLCDNGKADFLPYFFILEDAAEFAKQNLITFTCRGSAGGSLVLYAMGVSITDPIKYDLPFERFLTLGRILSGSLPDIDSDWENRDLILNYLRSKYGDSMALISTKLMLRLKSSILDCERAALGKVRPETAMILKNIDGAGQGASDKEWLFGYKDKTTGEHVPGFWDDKTDEWAVKLRNYAEDNPKIWASAMRCIGITRSSGIHAGGVVITPGPVSGYFPMMKTESGLATAWDMKGVESAGGVKYDFLGIETLDALGIAMKSVRDRTGADMTWREFDHDPKVYTEIIHKDHLEAIFQLNTDTVKPYVLRIKPTTIEEIAATTALIRPGALDAPSPDPSDPYTGSRTGSDDNIHAAEYFVRCREGRKKPFYVHPDLEPILGDTYGVLIYQEQTLKIFRDLAGYSYQDAEEVRRAIGKKIKELLEKHLGALKDKCLARGWNESQVKHLCDTIIASARYSFNKSHSVAYAQVAYNGCYLKLHHPLDFWKGELSVASQKHAKLKKYLKDCEVKILPIDVMHSHPTDWVVDGECLRPPLALIKGCGPSASGNLRRFLDLSLADFMSLGIVEVPEEEDESAQQQAEAG